MRIDEKYFTAGIFFGMPDSLLPVSASTAKNDFPNEVTG